MDGDTRRRSLKVVRVLCDGCERASASAYCTECKESACSVCSEQLHVRGRRSSKRAPARTCNGRAMKDLQKAVGVLPLCASCRTRPAYRYDNGDVHGLCKECHLKHKPGETAPGYTVVKRALAEELRRSSKSAKTLKSSTAPAAAESAARRRQKHSSSHSHSYHHKSRRERRAKEDDSTSDDLAFSRESLAD